MKKVILAVVIGISAISFVSCGNTEVNEDNIKDKYNEVVKRHIAIEIILNMLIGKSSNLYNELYKEGYLLS